MALVFFFIIMLYLIISGVKSIIENFSNKIKYKGVCAFDIDGTALNGSYNTCIYKGKKYDEKNGGCTLAAIKACKDKGFAIGVNTASFRDKDTFCCDVGMCSKGKKGDCLVKEKNWWNNEKYSAKKEKCGSNHGGCGKAYIMKKLYQSNNVANPRDAILWDDYHPNISAAYSSGWGVIPMPNLKKCKSVIGDDNKDIGIQQSQIDSFLNQEYKKWKPCSNFLTTNCSKQPCSKSTWYNQFFDPDYSF